jgi:hypothetical protein
MRNFLYSLLVILSLAACKPGIPKDIIQPDEMASVLHDIHLTDSYISNMPGPDSARIVAAAYYKGIYKKYHIDSALYAKSMNYYYDDPKVLKAIYVNVTGKLTKEKNAIVTADSLISANEVAKMRRRVWGDSTRKADSIFSVHFLLRDSARNADTQINRADVITLKMQYKGLYYLK